MKFGGTLFSDKPAEMLSGLVVVYMWDHVSSVKNCQQALEALELSTKTLAERSAQIAPWGDVERSIARFTATLLQTWTDILDTSAWEALGTTWPLASMYSLFLDTTPALKLDFGHKGAKDANRNQWKKLEEPLVFPWVPIKLMDCAQQLGLCHRHFFFISGEL